MSISAFIAESKIEEVVHFTTNRGLVGMLASEAVLSRRRLPRDKYLKNIAFPNAKFRPEESGMFDKSRDWLDYVNLSISRINGPFYDVSAKKWHSAEDVWWVMRIQPFVWSASARDKEQALSNVLRCSLATHGHPHGFIGAAFHALALWDALHDGRIGGPDQWYKYLHVLERVPQIIAEDRQLSAFWLPAWEHAVRKGLHQVVHDTIVELSRDIDLVRNLNRGNG